jgi:hypothetical protein
MHLIAAYSRRTTWLAALESATARGNYANRRNEKRIELELELTHSFLCLGRFGQFEGADASANLSKIAQSSVSTFVRISFVEN